jgi:hypothetical protein
VWNRSFGFGYHKRLSDIKSEQIKKAIVSIPPCSEYGWTPRDFKDNLDKICKKYCPLLSKDKYNIVSRSSLDCSRGLSIINIQLDYSVKGIPKNLKYELDTLKFASDYELCMSLIQEIGGLFRASTHLFFQCDFPIIPSSAIEKRQGGLTYIESGGKSWSSIFKTSEFCYPVIFMDEHIEQLKYFINKLSSVWHLQLFPIFRFLKALNAERIEMENILDLIFALEGLFKKNVSSDFIRVVSSLLISNSKKDANKIIEIIKTSYKIRNEIVHAGKHYTGMEKLKVNGKEIISQKIFNELKRIVAKMINFALTKMFNNSNLKYLRITQNDIINKYHK